MRALEGDFSERRRVRAGDPFARFTSLLFVPALKDRYLESALKSDADALIIDLEDAVPLSHKTAARDTLAGTVARCRRAGRIVFVRVNRGSGPDLDACRIAGPHGVFLPKVHGPEIVAETVARLGGESSPPLVAMVESARSVLNAHDIATVSDRVAALMFGAGDFVADTGFALTWEALRGPASTMALASIAAGALPWGLAGSIGILDDTDALEALARRSRAIGYVATPVIHPKQIDPVRRAFAPAPPEIAEARMVIAAFDASAGGATRLGDRLIERPVYLRAQTILRRAAGSHSVNDGD